MERINNDGRTRRLSTVRWTPWCRWRSTGRGRPEVSGFLLEMVHEVTLDGMEMAGVAVAGGDDYSAAS